MFNYCQKCHFDTKDKVHISEMLGLKPNRRLCTISCEICDTVKLGGTLDEYEYIDYTKENIDE